MPSSAEAGVAIAAAYREELRTEREALAAAKAAIEREVDE